jgi:RHS repeat-associated protein
MDDVFGTHSTTSYLISDRLGSARGVVDSAGNLVATGSYDTWGNDQVGNGVAARTPIGYAGGYTDPTGLIYLINRYYHPQMGQFLSVDPAIGQTWQPYQYANGDPVTMTDPTGMCTYLTGSVRCRTDKLLWGSTWPTPGT